MALTRITRGVIKPNENYDTHDINSTGIVTTTGLDVNGNADISGSLSVGGILTYEDVTSIDSVGIITARSGIDADDFISVGNNIHLGNAGVITATSFVGSGAALTGIDATAIKDSGGNVKIQAQASGAIHTGISTFDTIKVGSGVTIESNGQATFTGIVTFGSGSTTIDNNVVNVGTALTLGHTQGLQFHTQNLHSQGFEINQINASGIVTATTFKGNGDFVELNVDGHTNLDNVNIAGVTSTTGVFVINAGTQSTNKTTGALRVAGGAGIQKNVNVGGDLDVDGHTELDNVNIAGVATFSQGGSEVVRINSGGLLAYNDVSFFGDSTHAYWDKSANQFLLNDNTKISLGSSSDLQLWHNGNHSNIKNSTGRLYILADDIWIKDKNDGDLHARFLHDDACELYFDNGKKLETTNTGVTVTGTVAATAFTGDGSNLTGLASREFYGFVGVGNSLSLTTTNSGADNIDGAAYASFEESFVGPSGISFSINTSGNLIMSV